MIMRGKGNDRNQRTRGKEHTYVYKETENFNF